jgi:hypothetical protein
MTHKYYYVNEKYLPPPSPYSSVVKIELFVLSIVIVLFASTFYPFSSVAKTNELAVLGETTQITETPTPTSPAEVPLSGTKAGPPTPTIVPTNTPSPTPSPRRSPDVSVGTEAGTPTIKSARKTSYSIAVYGDSMVDTMGERCEYLEHALKKLYPSVNFTLYNFGKGSENVEMGLSRWNNRLDYQDRHYSSLPEIKPDIIILGSYAYNPFSPYNRDQHWVGLTKLIEVAKSITPNVYVLAEIAPLRGDFGKGPNGVNWDTQTAYEHSGRIVEQLENAVGLARTLNVPLIDVYHASIGKSGLNNAGDGIHASVTGHEFTADIIADTIQLN